MTIQSQLSNDGNVLTIKVTEKFDFSVQHDFRAAYRDVETASQVVLDLSQTSYMDSSSLGMLLLLRQHMEQFKGLVSIANPSPPIRKILEIANFDKLFTIN